MISCALAILIALLQRCNHSGRPLDQKSRQQSHCLHAALCQFLLLPLRASNFQVIRFWLSDYFPTISNRRHQSTSRCCTESSPSSTVTPNQALLNVLFACTPYVHAADELLLAPLSGCSCSRCSTVAGVVVARSAAQLQRGSSQHLKAWAHVCRRI